MTEEQIDLMSLSIGDKESTALKPAHIEIKDIEVLEVGQRKNQKVSLTCKHPDREETIKISSVRYPQKDKLKVSGLWFNLDEDKKIRKGSALAVLMTHAGAQQLSDLKGRNIATVDDEDGYLCIKAY